MASAPAQKPRMLGRYALYEKIASGGMASVHIGRLLGPVGFARTVAIKRMHPQYAEDPEFVAMFLDEARLAARIRHPNVVPTLDVVTTEGELFLVMEYVQGESLARLLRLAAARGERIAPDMAATAIGGVLHGLHAAHEAKNDRGEPLGIVHRDVTPQNILVGSDGVARVLDFGVAKAAGRLQTTRDGQLKGKIAYMAPEQLRGTVTRASDVYAVAVVLWEALTSRRLFAGESDAEVFGKVLAGDAPPPSALVPGVPSALDDVTLRGLCMDPSARFATAREMARALESSAPIVAASVIGEWVETVARQTLEERSARIAAIETDSSVDVRALRAPALASSPAVPIVVEDGDRTEISSGSASAPGEASLPAPLPRSSWGPALLGASAALIALVTLGVLWSLRGASQDRGVTASAPSASTPATAVPEATAPPPADPASPPVSPASPAPSRAVATAASAPSALVATPGKAPVRTTPAAPAAPAPRATSTAGVSCHPPYYFDSRGVRVFKPECL